MSVCVCVCGGGELGYLGPLVYKLYHLFEQVNFTTTACFHQQFG